MLKELIGQQPNLEVYSRHVLLYSYGHFGAILGVLDSESCRIAVTSR